MSGAVCSHMVMVVDDDRDLRLSIEEVLNDNEYRPLGAANGVEALERLREIPRMPCVILLDIMMPVMDGWQFLAVIKEDPVLAAIPVVVLSAHADLDDLADGITPVECVKKPVQLETLLSLVDRYCRKHKHASG